MVAEAELLLWNRPAAVVSHLLQQIGGSLYKSKTTLSVFCVVLKQWHQ